MTNRFSTDMEPVAAPVNVACEHDYATPHKTAVVIGVPQGGTSMVAAVVDALGFPISQEQYNFEPANTRPYCGDTEAEWVAKVAKINTELDVWGLKDTMIWRFSPQIIHNCLRNPYYLVVARDAIAVMQRRCANYELTQPVQITGVLQAAEAETRDMWKWVYALPPAPLLFISYERVLRNCAVACVTIANFLDATTIEEVQNAANRISAVGGYLLKKEPT